MRETLREPKRRQARLYQEDSRSAAVRRKNRRYRGRRSNGGTVLILLLFCALLAGGGIGTWKMAMSTAAPAPPPAPDTSASQPSGPADPAPQKTDQPVQTVSVNPVENQHPGDAEPLADPEPAAAPEEPPEQHIDMEPLPDDLNELVQGVVAEIITSDMTKMEQAKAVWDFTKNGIRYTGDSDKSNWEAGAREGLTARKGDCFTYYAVSRALLTALEIDNLEVQRVGGISSHYWNLVNCGDGWYHFDATPRSSKLPYFVSFMFTDQEAADYTVSVGGGREYYTFDGSLYPERATEKPWETAAGTAELHAQ